MSTKRNSLAKSYTKPKPASAIVPAAKSKPTETNAAIETGKAEIPYWVDSTHPEHMYRLVLFESGNVGEEEIDLSRAEYVTLKTHLAAMRGYFDSAELDERLARLAE